MVDALSDTPAVRFKLCFTGTSAADATTQAREAYSLAGETWEQITELCQFDLHFPFSTMCSLCKDVEYQLGPIDDGEVGDFINGAQLCRGQILIEDEQVCTFLHGLHQHVLEFATPQLKAMMAALCALD